MLSAHHYYAVLRDRSRPVAHFYGRVYDAEVASQLDLGELICREQNAHAVKQTMSV